MCGVFMCIKYVEIQVYITSVADACIIHVLQFNVVYAIHLYWTCICIHAIQVYDIHLYLMSTVENEI